MLSWVKKLFIVAAIVPMGVTPVAATCCGHKVHVDGSRSDSVTNTSMMMDVLDMGSGLEYPDISVPGAGDACGVDEDEVF
jgi:hypothetical protein